MFDAHGDTVAWQYAGSQLVHSIKHYKKTAALQVIRVLKELEVGIFFYLFAKELASNFLPEISNFQLHFEFQERSRDVIQTLSRYYSNTWGDYDKQAAINLFLGIFRC